MLPAVIGYRGIAVLWYVRA